jgi:hypothetical protein
MKKNSLIDQLIMSNLEKVARLSGMFVLVCSLLSCTSPPVNQEQVPADWQNYIPPSKDYSVKFPAGWQVTRTDNIDFLTAERLDFFTANTDPLTAAAPISLEQINESYEQNMDATSASLEHPTITEFDWVKDFKGVTISGNNLKDEKRIYKVVLRNKRQSFRFTLRNTDPSMVETFEQIFKTFEVLQTNN